MWCKDITECLIADDDRLEAMKGAEQMCVKVHQALIRILLFSFVFNITCFSNL